MTFAINSSTSPPRFVPGTGLRHRGAVVDPAWQDRPWQDASGSGHRVSRHSERLRDVFHDCGGTHRRSLELQQEGEFTGISRNLHPPACAGDRRGGLSDLRAGRCQRTIPCGERPAPEKAAHDLHNE